MRFFFYLFLSLVILQHSVFPQKNKPQNIILLVGDGMGLNYVSASILSTENNPFLKFNSVGLSITCSADKLITDSGASATAIATGYSTNNHYISIDIEKKPLKTLFELAEEMNMATGLVVTSSVTHATPASFVSHVNDRNEEEEIARQITELDLEVVIGGGLKFFLPKSSGGVQENNLVKKIKEKGYLFFENIDELKNNRIDKEFFALLDSNGLKPALERDFTLGELTSEALNFLSKKENGFVLLVEGSQIDWAAHDNQTERVLAELKDFNSAVIAALDFAEKDGNTLVVVTTDHETGGMAITGGDRDGGNIKLSYASGSHTAEMVGVFAKGPGEENFRGVYNNYFIGRKLFHLLHENYKFNN